MTPIQDTTRPQKRVYLHALFPLVMALLVLAACSRTPTAEPTPDTSGVSYRGLNPGALVAYHATYLMQFTGESNWSYRLDLRSDGQAVEYLLHMEGLSRSKNPGDIRMVSQGEANRMRGPGTEDECVQFPRDLVLGPAFLTPDDILPPETVGPLLQARAPAAILGVDTEHYAFSRPDLSGWDQVQVELWQDPVTGAVLRYDLVATGTDPLFEAGRGTLTGRYQVNAIEAQTIAPVTGCEIDLPIPENRRGLIKLPGLVAFETPNSLDEMVAFYQSELPAMGWDPEGEPLVGPNATVLSFRRQGESLDINLEASGEGVTVELLTES